ncbi:hypothetical protein V495_00824 [Pseudogymnoascus sp. VKM F-4514 (FW-929)]|nr:hypothetical protein V495_00824 [Pseudogymnoascus sp. VKM F-4514 (FW-929)]KFY65154.1 hypothetical protein V497_01484 [Pseudogymnoascus sp. VKM F-4516 (FW-969)]
MKAIYAVPATVLVAYRAYSHKSLTPAGIVVAVLTAIAHAVHPWNLPFVLLVVFFLAGTRVTKVKKEAKEKLTIQATGGAGGEGPRTHIQVLANSLVATVLALVHAYTLSLKPEVCYGWGRTLQDVIPIGIIANYAAVAADTFSSELGILSTHDPRLITSPTLRRVPRGTNGGVTLWGLFAGLLGSFIVVFTALFFTPFCPVQQGPYGGTLSSLQGGAGWGWEEKKYLAIYLTIWGALGSVLDSVLGGLFQQSVKDTRTGRIVEGEGGKKVLISKAVPKIKKTAEVRAAAFGHEGKKSVPSPAEIDDSHGPTRVAESGWAILDNNEVNFLMAVNMSLGAMLIAAQCSIDYISILKTLLPRERNMTTPPVDVLIVGAGPTGLAMGLELALHKVPFRIIDKSQVPSDKSRALVVQPRTLELLRRHRITEDISQRSTDVRGARIFVNKSQVAEVDISDIGLERTAFTRPEIISQAETEAIMALKLTSGYGVNIERGVEVEQMDQDATGVSLRWDMVGSGEAQEWKVFMSSTGFMILFPFKDGSVRVVGTLAIDPNENDAEGIDPTLEDFQELFNKMAPGTGELYDPSWIAKFRLHHRGVNNYRNGRLFVAGDAAHIHSPAGGQGMNTGIHDAINLGWKLARVLSGRKRAEEVSEKLLDSYNEERRPVGQKLLKGTDRMFGYMASTNYLWLLFRNFLATWVLPWVMSSRELRAKAFWFISELGIRYRKSPIVSTAIGFTGSMRGGDRAADGKCETPAGGDEFLLDMCRGDCFHLILFAGRGAQMATPADLKSIITRFTKPLATRDVGEIEIHRVYSSKADDESGILDPEGELHKVYGFNEPGYVLVRPDTYIAHIGLQSAMDGLLEWLEENY